MADNDANANKDGKDEGADGKAGAGAGAGETPEQKQAAKAAAEAAAKAAKEAEEAAEKEAAEERRINKAAEKLAEKKVKDALSAQAAEASRKAEREKMDETAKARAEADEASEKLKAVQAELAAARLSSEISAHLVTKSLTPANPAALGYIQAAVQRELAAGADDTEKALAKVQKAEPFLFKQPAPAGAGERKPIDTGGKAEGAQERAAPEGSGEGQGQRQFKTKPPSEIDLNSPTARADLQASVRERHGIMPTFH